MLQSLLEEAFQNDAHECALSPAWDEMGVRGLSIAN